MALVLGVAVVLLAAANVTLVVLFSRRSRRLAKLRMDFVTSVSHELRTPLAVIRSAAENLADGVVQPGDSVREYGRLIREESRRLGAMVERILLFSSVRSSPSYRPRPLDVGPIIEGLLAEAASAIRSAGVSVEKHVDPELPQALSDEGALKECLLNLISNALKYGADGHWMSIRAMVATEATGPEIQVTVKDRGPGIEPGELEQIFEPFFRGDRVRSSQTHGSGLGLSLTKQIIEAVGGKITVLSEPGRGSAFTLHLPIAWP